MNRSRASSTGPSPPHTQCTNLDLGETTSQQFGPHGLLGDHAVSGRGGLCCGSLSSNNCSVKNQCIAHTQSSRQQMGAAFSYFQTMLDSTNNLQGAVLHSCSSESLIWSDAELHYAFSRFPHPCYQQRICTTGSTIIGRRLVLGAASI